MRYPIAIELGTATTAFGVVIPDLPGCFGAGDTLDAAIADAKKAAVLWIDITLQSGGSIPTPSAPHMVRNCAVFKGMLFDKIVIRPAA